MVSRLFRSTVNPTASLPDGRIAAGAYDYSLVRGKGINLNNWYLSSWQDQGDTAQVLRPESGAYATNLALSNNLFTTRLHDLIGKTQYTDVMTGEKSATSMWVRNEGGHNRSRDSSGQLKTQANRYVLQIGAILPSGARTVMTYTISV
nr:autotransporter outer membrane beta-barrel domain-containing protein [Klebsiella pneumoniae]